MQIKMNDCLGVQYPVYIYRKSNFTLKIRAFVI